MSGFEPLALYIASFGSGGLGLFTIGNTRRNLRNGLTDKFSASLSVIAGVAFIAAGVSNLTARDCKTYLAKPSQGVVPQP